jgi:hypothetical protein
VQIFSRRVRQLEQFIASQQLTVPDPYEDDSETLAQLSALFMPDEQPASPQKNAGHEQLQDPSVETPSWPNDSRSMPGPAVLPPTLGASVNSQPDTTSLPFLDAAESMTILQPDPSIPSWSTDDPVDADWVWTMATMPQFGVELESAPELFHSSYADDDVLIPPREEGNSLDFASPPTPREDGSGEDEDNHSAVSNQLSARLGTLLLTSCGESHYYGSTSNFNLVPHKSIETGRQQPYYSSQQAQERLRLCELDPPIATELVNHLLNLYFTWHDPSLHVVDWDLFTKDRSRFESGEADTAFFSPILINAMYVTIYPGISTLQLWYQD